MTVGLRKLQSKDVGKVMFVHMSKTTIVWRWIVEQKGDRFYGRSPKVGVKIRDLKLCNDKDYGPKRLISLVARVKGEGRKSRSRKTSKLLK